MNKIITLVHTNTLLCTFVYVNIFVCKLLTINGIINLIDDMCRHANYSLKREWCGANRQMLLKYLNKMEYITKYTYIYLYT